MSNKTLYARLGGNDAISAVANDLLPRLQADPQLARYWHHRGEDGVNREKQLLIDFLCSSAGGPLYYTGRDDDTDASAEAEFARDRVHMRVRRGDSPGWAALANSPARRRCRSSSYRTSGFAKLSSWPSGSAMWK